MKKHPTLGVWCTPLKCFSEFYKLFLGFYKSQFSGTTFVLVEKLLLLVYGLFRNSKNLTFVRVRRHKTLNDAICLMAGFIPLIIFAELQQLLSYFKLGIHGKISNLSLSSKANCLYKNSSVYRPIIRGKGTDCRDFLW